MPRMFLRPSKAVWNSARSRSILLMKTTAGRAAVCTSDQALRVSGLTPSTASMTKTAPSAAARE